MRLLDTNIVLYARGSPHPLREPCVRILAAASQTQAYNIDVELLQELVHVLSRRGERSQGLELVDDLLGVFPSPFPISRSEIVVARALLARYPTLGSRYAIHAAVVLEHQLDGLVTADRDFDHVPEIVRFNPLTL